MDPTPRRDQESAVYVFFAVTLAVFVALLPFVQMTRPNVIVKAIVSASATDFENEVSGRIRSSDVLFRAFETAKVPRSPALTKSLQVRTVPSLDADRWQAEIQLEHNQPAEAVRFLEALLQQLQSNDPQRIGQRVLSDQATFHVRPSLTLVNYEYGSNSSLDLFRTDVNLDEPNIPAAPVVSSGPERSESTPPSASTAATDSTKPVDVHVAQTVQRTDQQQQFQAELEEAEFALEELQLTFDQNHPLVKSAQQQVDDLKAKLDKITAAHGSKSEQVEVPIDNPIPMQDAPAQETTPPEAIPLEVPTDLPVDQVEETKESDAFNATNWPEIPDESSSLPPNDVPVLAPPATATVVDTPPVGPITDPEWTPHSASEPIAVVSQPSVVWKDGVRINKVQLMLLFVVAAVCGLVALKWRTRSTTKTIQDSLDAEIATDARVLASLFPQSDLRTRHIRRGFFQWFLRSNEMILIAATLLVVHASLTDRLFRESFVRSPLAAYSEAFWQFWA